MSKRFASTGLTVDQLKAIVEKLGGYDGAIRFIRGKLVVSKPTRSWRYENGIIYFDVISDGTTGEDWIKRLKDGDFLVANYVEQALRLSNFKPTSSVTTKIAVLLGEYFVADYWVMERICARADEMKLSKPNLELTCLIRDKFTREDVRGMGLAYILPVYDPTNDYDDAPRVLEADRYGDQRYSDASYRYIKDFDIMIRAYGFAFVVS